MLQKTLYFEPLRDVERNFKFVQFFLYTLSFGKARKGGRRKEDFKK